MLVLGLANAVGATGKQKKHGVAETRRTLAVRTKMLGEAHPGTLEVMRELALALHNSRVTEDRREAFSLDQKLKILYAQSRALKQTPSKPRARQSHNVDKRQAKPAMWSFTGNAGSVRLPQPKQPLGMRGGKVGLSGPAAGSSAATECVGYSAARLAAAEAAHRVRCTWVCIHASLHCVSHAHQDFKAQGSHLKGAEWEAGCKRMINARFELEGTDAVVAGLFGGDYLPLVSAKVGRDGTVYGFEPTDAVDVSRALADANGLSNVKIEQTCLSSDHSVIRMCMRDARAEPG